MSKFFNLTAPCPQCAEHVRYIKRRENYYCDECQIEFHASVQAVVPQTIFLSYAHKSEREDDFDISEELVLLIKAELDKDGHQVWIDKEGIRAGGEWRERITSAILEHTHFLSFLSRRSVRDPGVCLNEIAMALCHVRNIQTVLAGPEEQVSPPLTISHLQWHDFQDWREVRAGSKTGTNGETWEAWFSQRMELVRHTVGNEQNAQASGQLQRLKDLLVPSSFEARIIEKTEGFFGRQWLFDATQDWLDNSASRMFWLKASPGIGKSAFAAKLTHKARSAVIGFFMCDFQGMKNPEEAAREAICTLAFQMASRLPDYRAKLIYQQQVDKEKMLRKSADDLFEYLITEPLNKSDKIPEATRLCLVIDGLDEAGQGNCRNALADLLVKHINRLPEWLGIVVTSRPEPYLEQILKPLSGISVDGQSDLNREDLIDWIDKRLPLNLKDAERQRLIDLIIEKSGGTFLYLRLVEKDNSLDFSKPEVLPNKLDGFFKQNFNRYFPNTNEYGHKTEPFLRLLVAAPGPLPVQMAQQILEWSQREVTLHVTEPMGSLLQEREEGVVLFHASLFDWLKEPKRSGSHCVNDGGHKQLGEFIWRAFEENNSQEWRNQVINWIAELMPYVSQWGDPHALNRVASFLEVNRRFMPARTLRKRLLELYSQESVERAMALEWLGDNYIESGVGDEDKTHFYQAIKLLELAWQLRKQTVGSNDPLTLMTLAKIPYGDAGRYVEGLAALKTVLQNGEYLHPSDLLKAQANYAYYMYEAGKFLTSKDIYLQILKSYEPNSIGHTTALCLVGFIEYELGNWLDCVKVCKEAIDAIKLAEVGSDFDSNPTHLLSTIQFNLGMSLHALQLHTEALPIILQAQAGFKLVMSESSPWWSSIWVGVGIIHKANGNIKEALQLANQAALISEEQLGETHFEPTCAWLLQAQIILEAGEKENAISLIERAIKVRKNTLPYGHWRTLNCEEILAFVLRQKGDLARSDQIVLSWDERLSGNLSSSLSLDTVVRVSCRIAAALWRVGDRTRAKLWIAQGIDRCRVEGSFDLINRLGRIEEKMQKDAQ